MTQTSILKFCVKLSPEEVRERNRQEIEAINDRFRAKEAKDLSVVEMQRDQKRQQAKERQRRCRERKRIKEIEMGLRHNDGKLKKTVRILKSTLECA